jgi:hypothetical protein
MLFLNWRKEEACSLPLTEVEFVTDCHSMQMTVVLLIKPTVQEAVATVELLKIFGLAAGLRCNLDKSSVSPIRCQGIDLQ